VTRWQSWLATLEAMVYLFAVRTLRRTVPMRMWSKLMGFPHSASLSLESGQHESPPGAARAQATTAERNASQGVSRACKRFPKVFSCLDQACAGQLMLRRQGFPGIVVIGLARTSNHPNTEDLAHAWLETPQGNIIIGGSSAEEYLPVTRFVLGSNGNHK
jgi:hypothetical protein